jgi:uncharacterized protein
VKEKINKIGLFASKSITLIPILLVKGYQYFISPFFPNSCRYIPSCSEYSLQAYKKHGFIKGTWLTINRLRKCHPWGGHGYDPVP